MSYLREITVSRLHTVSRAEVWILSSDRERERERPYDKESVESFLICVCVCVCMCIAISRHETHRSGVVRKAPLQSVVSQHGGAYGCGCDSKCHLYFYFRFCLIKKKKYPAASRHFFFSYFHCIESLDVRRSRMRLNIVRARNKTIFFLYGVNFLLFIFFSSCNLRNLIA